METGKSASVTDSSGYDVTGSPDFHLFVECFLNQVCTWFLEIVLSVNVGVCVSALRALIASDVKGMHNNRIRQFYSFSIFYMTLAINKFNGRGLSNTVS